MEKETLKTTDSLLLAIGYTGHKWYLFLKPALICIYVYVYTTTQVNTGTFTHHYIFQWMVNVTICIL